MSLWDIVESDLPIFFDPDGLAESALLKGVTVINIHFFNGYKNALGEEWGIASSEPYALARSSDVVGVQQGDTLELDGTLYKIANVEPDETGVTILRLSR